MKTPEQMYNEMDNDISRGLFSGLMDGFGFPLETIKRAEPPKGGYASAAERAVKARRRQAKVTPASNSQRIFNQMNNASAKSTVTPSGTVIKSATAPAHKLKKSTVPVASFEVDVPIEVPTVKVAFDDKTQKFFADYLGHHYTGKRRRDIARVLRKKGVEVNFIG